MTDSQKDEFKTLTDGVIALQCLRISDVLEHWTGEDEDQVRWLSEVPSTQENVRSWIESNINEWSAAGPRRNFGIRDVESQSLVGNVEANFAREGAATGEVNISYVVFPAWRGHNIAAKAVSLMVEWIRNNFDATVAVIRIERNNIHSHGVAIKAGFDSNGVESTADGKQLVRYEKQLIH